MANYSLPEPSSETEIGRRAKRLRDLRCLTPDQVASQASVDVGDVVALESGGEVSLAAALAIHCVLSSESFGDALFHHPRLTSIDEVEEFERRRLQGP